MREARQHFIGVGGLGTHAPDHISIACVLRPNAADAHIQACVEACIACALASIFETLVAFAVGPNCGAETRPILRSRFGRKRNAF